MNYPLTSDGKDKMINNLQSQNKSLSEENALQKEQIQILKDFKNANEIIIQTLKSQLEKLQKDNDTINWMKGTDGYNKIIKNKQQLEQANKVIEQLKEWYDQSDFESPEEAIDYLHVRTKIGKIISQYKND